VINPIRRRSCASASKDTATAGRLVTVALKGNCIDGDGAIEGDRNTGGEQVPAFVEGVTMLSPRAAPGPRASSRKIVKVSRPPRRCWGCHVCSRSNFLRCGPQFGWLAFGGNPPRRATAGNGARWRLPKSSRSRRRRTERGEAGAGSILRPIYGRVRAMGSQPAGRAPLPSRWRNACSRSGWRNR
jgi:hypothetical protein